MASRFQSHLAHANVHANHSGVKMMKVNERWPKNVTTREEKNAKKGGEGSRNVNNTEKEKVKEVRG